MPPKHKRTFWRTLRIYFRRFRISIWLLILVLICSGLYVNQVGLPNFIKNPLLAKLRARGVDLQFSRLRLRWFEGIVADNVQFGGADVELAPRVTAREVRLQLNFDALLRRQLQVDALQIRHGRIVWELQETNAPQGTLSIDDIQTQLRFLPGDEWRLDGLKAGFAGGRIYADGTITHATALGQWDFARPGGPTDERLLREKLARFSARLERIQFAEPPELTLHFSGDGSDVRSFGGQLSIQASGAVTPWGKLSKVGFDLKLSPANTNGVSVAEINLSSAGAETPWASATNLSLALSLSSQAANTNLVNASLKVSASQSTSRWATRSNPLEQTEWVAGSNTVLIAQWVQSITNPIPISGSARLENQSIASGWGSARDVELDLLDFQRSVPGETHPSWMWWTNLEPYHLSWTCRLKDLRVERVEVASLALAGTWSPPELTVTNLVADLYDGTLGFQGGLDVSTRIARVEVRSLVDPRKFERLLPAGARKWLSDCSWGEAPRLDGTFQATLPRWEPTWEAWKNADWRGQVQPTLAIDGRFALTNGASYRGIEVNTAESLVTYSNLNWHLTNLVVTRPEGVLIAEHRADDSTRNFYWRLHSSVDIGIIRPLLNSNAQRGFELLSVSGPPVIEAEIRGRLHEPELTGGRAHLVLTNFAFRGQTATFLETDVEYTNKILKVLSPRLERGTQHLRADFLLVDLNTQLIYVTNGFSTAEPLAVAQAIGPKIAEAVEDYQFLQPPTARVYGTIPMRGEEDADLHFEIEGGPFHWWRFDLPWVSGHLHWAGLHLSLTNVQADFYGGKATGAAGFDFVKGEDTKFHFAAATTNCLLPDFVAGVFLSTNRLEGRFDGTVVVTSALTEDWRSVQGYGDLRLRDGLIWDIPLFGIFSPVLDGIIPGLGKSRATAAVCTFVMTNGVARSDDLEIRATGMRLMYRGTADLESRVKARVEAEPLRDIWVVGPLVSTVLWPVTKMFEYKVTGTLSQPQMEPVGIVPKVVLLPFAPLRLLKVFGPGDPSITRTNAIPSPKDSSK